MAIFSSNYTLYGSLSNRVMSMLSHYSPHIDQYSIDESFFDVDQSMAERFFQNNLKENDTFLNNESLLHQYGARISADVLRAVGIPISIGIAETKTLAKSVLNSPRNTRVTKAAVSSILMSEDTRLYLCSR